jgi:hypothetical protein
VRAAQVVLAVSESPVVRAARVVLVVLEKPAEPAGREAPVVSESPGVREVRVVPVVLESPAGRVAPENPVVQVGPQPEQKLAVAEAAPRRPRSPAEAVALTVSAVINPQRAGAAVAAEALSAEEAGHLPKRPAIAVAAAWEVGEEGAVVAAEAAAAPKKEAAAKKEAAGDAAAKRDERTKNIQTKNYELIKTSVPCVSAGGFQFCLCRFNSGAAAEIGYRGWSAA